MRTKKLRIQKLWFCILMFIGVTIQAQVMPEVAQGTIKRHLNFPSNYITPRSVDVWLPNGYTTDKKYNVLYMHDGQLLYDATVTWNKQEWDVDTVMQGMIDSAMISETIVVGVHNIGKERHSDYFPQKPFESLSSKTRDSILKLGRGEHRIFSKPVVHSDKYLKFLVEELIPFVNSNYSTKRGSENTFIAGSSMGGLISWYALCEYPDVFGGAACLSTHWPGIFTAENNPIPQVFIDYLEQHLPDPESHKIYFDYGTETLDALYEPFQMKVDEILKQKGYSKSNWKTLKFEGEDHSEIAWNKRLHIPLEFLLAKTN